MPFQPQRHAQFDGEYSLPILCQQVRISYEIVGAPRMNGQFTVFNYKKVSVIVYGFEEDEMHFDIKNFAIKLIPDMDKMIIIGTPRNDKHDIFIFFSSQKERDKCIKILELVGCTMWDTFNNRFLQKRKTTSQSLPNMLPIAEEM